MWEELFDLTSKRRQTSKRRRLLNVSLIYQLKSSKKTKKRFSVSKYSPEFPGV
jgi:hypothetical protein